MAHARPEVEALIDLLGSVLSPRAALLEHRIAWALAEGPRFVFDPRERTPFVSGWTRDADLTIFLNAAALLAWLDGTLDPSDPQPGEILLWAGDPAALSALARVLQSSGTALRLRAGNKP
jgi:hypothetical protein